MTWLGSLFESTATRVAGTLAWWQWLILAAIPPAIILLYFLKLKRRPVEVPSTYLWHKSIEDLHVNSIWQRLRNNLLMYLQLLLILLAALALLRPSFEGRKLTGSRSIFLVDTSASMQASDVAPTRLDEAKRRVRALIDEMQTGDVAMIVSFADSAKVEQPFTDDRRRLREAVDGIQPTERPTLLIEALQVASGLANPGRTGDPGNPMDVQVSEAMPADVYIFSDGRFGAITGFSLGNLRPTFVPIGTGEAANVAISALGVERTDAREPRLQAFGRIENFGKADRTVLVELYLNDLLIDSARLELPAGESRGEAFDLGDVDSGVLRLKVGDKDDLAVDDEAWAVIHPPRLANVLLVTPGNVPLELALQTRLTAEIARVQIERPAFLTDPKYAPLAAGGVDLMIFDRCKPASMPQCNTLFIAELPPQGDWKASEAVNVPRIIDIDGSHPLLQWLDLGDVLIATGTPITPPSGGRVLLDSDGGALLAVAPREIYEDAVLGFSIADQNSNWYVRASYPPFLFNLIGYMGGGRRIKGLDTVRPGRPVPLEAPTGKAVLQIRSPDGQLADLPTSATGTALFTSTDGQGVYDVQAGGKSVGRFAVNLFDAAESQIAVGENPSLRIGYVDVEGSRDWHTARKDLWKWILAVGLAVLCLEWYIYNRRVYV